VFSFNGHCYKQIDGCGMGNPLSSVLANIFKAKLESDVGSQKFPENGKEIASLATSTEPNVSLLILTTKSKQLKKNFSKCWTL